MLTQDDSDIEDEALKMNDDLPTELHATVDYIAEVAQAINAVIPDKPWLAPLEQQIVAPNINREETWKTDRDLAFEFAMFDVPDEQDQRPFVFDLEEMSHTTIYGSTGFGKSNALQTLAMALARKNTPEQVHFNLFDFGTNGLLVLKDLPHSADLARLEDEDKLAKFLNIIKSEVARRKELFTEASVASLSQYEAKTGENLPVIVNLFDGWDSLRENPMEDDVEFLVTQLLRDGANVGMYVVMTALKANSLRMNLSGNMPTKIGLYFTDEGDMPDIVGKDKLPPEEIPGRGQIKLENVLAMQIYLPTEGTNDLERLNALSAEAREMMSSWTGEKPKKVPMLPNEISMDWFLENDQVQEWITAGNIPLGFSQVTTEVRGYQPQIDPYFLIADADMAQTEYVTKTLEQAFALLGGSFNRVIFDMTDNYENRYDLFDEIYSPNKINEIMKQIITHVSGEEMAMRSVEIVNTPEPIEFTIDFDLLADLPEMAPLTNQEEATEEIEATEAIEVTEAIEENSVADLLEDMELIGETPTDEFDEIIEEIVELKTPMLIYLPNVVEFLEEINLSDSDAKIFMKNAKAAGIHFLFHTSTTNIYTFRTGIGKYITEMTRTGFVGQRSADQEFINVKVNYNEPLMSDGEHSYFNKKTIERVRTIDMSE